MTRGELGQTFVSQRERSHDPLCLAIAHLCSNGADFFCALFELSSGRCKHELCRRNDPFLRPLSTEQECQ